MNAKRPTTERHVIAETRTFAILMENVSQIASSTKPQSRQHPELQVTTSAWRKMTENKIQQPQTLF